MLFRRCSMMAIVCLALFKVANAQNVNAQVESNGNTVGAEPITVPPVTKPAIGPQGGKLQKVENLQVETILNHSGLQLFAYDSQGQPVDMREGRGAATLKIAGEAKRYRYDLISQVLKGKNLSSLAVTVELSRFSGKQVDLAIQIAGVPGAERRPLKFKSKAMIPMTEAQKVAAEIEAQRVCPVSGQPLGSMGKPIAVAIGDQSVYVCCAGCIDPVKADPEKYLTAIQPMQSKVVLATKDDAAAVAIQKRCPVMDEPLDSMGGPYRTIVLGRVVYLCCPGCGEKLNATPAVYLNKLKDQGITPPAADKAL